MRVSKPLRINWILPRVGLAGGVKSNRLIAEAMIRRGHSVTIAYVAGGDPWPHPWRVRQFTKRMASAWRTLGKPAHHLVQSTADLVAAPGRPVRAADLPDADVSIGTWWETIEWIRDWPESKGIKAHFVRHYEIYGGDPDRVDAVYHIDTCKLVIAQWLQRLMGERFGCPDAALVPNGVDRTQFDSAPRAKGKTPTVGFVYSPMLWKGCETAFAAIELARKEIPNLRVVCFGSSQIRRQGAPLPPGIEFHLRPGQAEIPEFYRRADCWLISSTSEGFGMPGLEAQACHCPVISTRCGGPEDYVRHGENGYLVNVGDAADMARRIVEVVSASDASWRAMSAAAYAVSREFDWDRSAELLENALVAAVDGKRPERLIGLAS